MDILDFNEGYAMAYKEVLKARKMLKKVPTRQKIQEELSKKNTEINKLVAERSKRIDRKKELKKDHPMHYNRQEQAKINGLTMRIQNLRKSCQFEEYLLKCIK
jgi:hypothetical protein